MKPNKIAVNIMIFLGAGASKVFGIKTMQDLTDDLVQKMRDKGHGETINEILSALKRFGLTPDFENIHTTVDALVDLKEGIRKSGAFAAYVASKGGFQLVTEQPKFKDVLQDFRKLIYNECSIGRGIIEKNKGILDNLFRICAHNTENRILSSKMGRAGDNVGVDIGKTIVTTNYDMAIELYHRRAGFDLADGFKTTGKEYIKDLDFHEYGRGESKRWLIKLHGSIWQFNKEDKVIQTIAPPDSLPLEISVGEQMMIYPVGEKPILREPYFSFYSIFKEQLWDILIAIGYSFRDEPVNTAILERMNSRFTRMGVGSRPKLIVINPNAESVIGNLGPIGSELEERIIRIDETFRDEEVLFKRIEVAVDSPNWTSYKRRVKRYGLS